MFQIPVVITSLPYRVSFSLGTWGYGSRWNRIYYLKSNRNKGKGVLIAHSSIVIIPSLISDMKLRLQQLKGSEPVVSAVFLQLNRDSNSMKDE